MVSLFRFFFKIVIIFIFSNCFAQISSPVDVSGLVIWLDADTTLARLSNGAEVDTAYDQSGNSHHFRGDIDIFKKPSIHTNQLNGHAAYLVDQDDVTFHREDIFQCISSAATFNFFHQEDSSFTFFYFTTKNVNGTNHKAIIATMSTFGPASTGNHGIAWGTDNRTGVGASLLYGQNNTIDVINVRSDTNSFVSNRWQLVEFSKDSSVSGFDYSILISDSSRYAQNIFEQNVVGVWSTSNATKQLTIGDYLSDDGNWTGDFYFNIFLVYNPKLSDSDAKLVRDYILSRFSMPINVARRRTLSRNIVW